VRLRTALRLVLVLGLVASACGGSSDSSVDSTSPQSGSTQETAPEASVDAQVEAVVDAIVAAHGQDGGFNAVIWALERGYSGDQLFAGALEERLQAVGVITDAAGGTEPPDGSPLGLITLPDPDLQSMGVTAIPAAYRPNSNKAAAWQDVPIERFKDFLANSHNALAVIIAASSSGYSGRQIVEAVIVGGREDEIFETFYGTPCTVIRDGLGHIVVPESKTADYWGCKSRISDRAREEQADSETATEGDPSAAGGAVSNEIHASGQIPSHDEDTEITSSLFVIGLCDGGRVHASFSMEGRFLDVPEGDQLFSNNGSGTGSWNAGKRSGSVTGSYTGTLGSGEWSVEFIFTDDEVVATDSFGQTITIPIIDEPAALC